MNAQALKHEGAVEEIYSKMKPDTFMSQLQTILTAYYEDIKLVVSASTNSKVVKHKRTRLAPDADTADATAADNNNKADTANPATLQDWGEAAASGGEEPPLAPSPGGRSGGCKGRAGGVGKKAFWQGLSVYT
jgi:hypothetical protein